MKYFLITLFCVSFLDLKGQVTQPGLTPDLISIISKDIVKSSKWYQENLGFKLIKTMDFPEYDSLKIHFLERDGFKIEIVEKKKAEARSRFSSFENPLLQGFNKISFKVSDIKTLAKTLSDRKVNFKTKVFHDEVFKLTSFIIEDPEGNLLQFVEYDK
jgi:catechol 2,3-dioxygenase-like lactoylglutathione lyase family enzyme